MGQRPPRGKDGPSLRHCPAEGCSSPWHLQDMDDLDLSLSGTPVSVGGKRNVNLIPCSVSSLS